MRIIIFNPPVPRIMKPPQTGTSRRHTCISACFASLHKHLFNALFVRKTIVTVKNSSLKIEQKMVNNHYLFFMVDIN